MGNDKKIREIKLFNGQAASPYQMKHILLYCLIGLSFILGHRQPVTCHYKNMSMQYTAIFHGCKNDNFL